MTIPDWFKDICHKCTMATGKRLDANQKHFLWVYISKPENLARILEVKRLIEEANNAWHFRGNNGDLGDALKPFNSESKTKGRRSEGADCE